MKLAELAFACYIYGPMTDYDNTYFQFLEKTKPQLELSNAEHRKALLKWLNDWGCRQFSVKYHGQASKEIGDWFRDIGSQLFSNDKSLLDLTDIDLNIVNKAYAKLVHRTASVRALRNGASSIIEVGPTGTAKILYALRPNSLIPWDVPMRSKFNFRGSSDDYINYLKLVRKNLEELNGECKQFGYNLSDLPRILGRPRSSLTKLIDEYYWITVSRNCPAPAIQKLSQWAQWW